MHVEVAQLSGLIIIFLARTAFAQSEGLPAPLGGDPLDGHDAPAYVDEFLQFEGKTSCGARLDEGLAQVRVSPNFFWMPWNGQKNSCGRCIRFSHVFNGKSVVAKIVLTVPGTKVSRSSPLRFNFHFVDCATGLPARYSKPAVDYSRNLDWKLGQLGNVPEAPPSTSTLEPSAGSSARQGGLRVSTVTLTSRTARTTTRINGAPTTRVNTAPATTAKTRETLTVKVPAVRTVASSRKTAPTTTGTTGGSNSKAQSFGQALKMGGRSCSSIGSKTCTETKGVKYDVCDSNKSLVPMVCGAGTFCKQEGQNVRCVPL
ncbi:hypothetical protein HDV05_005204 [Chytridiales sp. JEL 0842]|nr:hypothetical protein HDV05_005204 [Chytridiales sp. JEL 0842]